jgi:hypothetical protein
MDISTDNVHIGYVSDEHQVLKVVIDFKDITVRFTLAFVKFLEMALLVNL